jgi:transcriptional regulator with XRE-family HTH domain
MLASELRAARGLLGWSQTELSSQSGVAVASIRRFEIGATGLTTESVNAIVQTIRSAGVAILSVSEDAIGAIVIDCGTWQPK